MNRAWLVFALHFGVFINVVIRLNFILSKQNIHIFRSLGLHPVIVEEYVLHLAVKKGLRTMRLLNE